MCAFVYFLYLDVGIKQRFREMWYTILNILPDDRLFSIPQTPNRFYFYHIFIQNLITAGRIDTRIA